MVIPRLEELLSKTSKKKFNSINLLFDLLLKNQPPSNNNQIDLETMIN